MAKSAGFMKYSSEIFSNDLYLMFAYLLMSFNDLLDYHVKKTNESGTYESVIKYMKYIVSSDRRNNISFFSSLLYSYSSPLGLLYYGTSWGDISFVHNHKEFLSFLED